MTFIWTSPDPLNNKAKTRSIYVTELQSAINVKRVEIAQSQLSFINQNIGKKFLLGAIEELKTVVNQLAIDFGYPTGVEDADLLGRSYVTITKKYGKSVCHYPILNDLRTVLNKLEGLFIETWDAADDYNESWHYNNYPVNGPPIPPWVWAGGDIAYSFGRDFVADNAWHQSEGYVFGGGNNIGFNDMTTLIDLSGGSDKKWTINFSNNVAAPVVWGGTTGCSQSCTISTLSYLKCLRGTKKLHLLGELTYTNGGTAVGHTPNFIDPFGGWINYIDIKITYSNGKILHFVYRNYSSEYLIYPLPDYPNEKWILVADLNNFDISVYDSYVSKWGVAPTLGWNGIEITFHSNTSIWASFHGTNTASVYLSAILNKISSNYV